MDYIKERGAVIPEHYFRQTEADQDTEKRSLEVSNFIVKDGRGKLVDFVQTRDRAVKSAKGGVGWFCFGILQRPATTDYDDNGFRIEFTIIQWSFDWEKAEIWLIGERYWYLLRQPAHIRYTIWNEVYSKSKAWLKLFKHLNDETDEDNPPTWDSVKKRFGDEFFSIVEFKEFILFRLPKEITNYEGNSYLRDSEFFETLRKYQVGTLVHPSRFKRKRRFVTNKYIDEVDTFKPKKKKRRKVAPFWTKKGSSDEDEDDDEDVKKKRKRKKRKKPKEKRGRKKKKKMKKKKKKKPTRKRRRRKRSDSEEEEEEEEEEITFRKMDCKLCKKRGKKCSRTKPCSNCIISNTEKRCKYPGDTSCSSSSSSSDEDENVLIKDLPKSPKSRIESSKKKKDNNIVKEAKKKSPLKKSIHPLLESDDEFNDLYGSDSDEDDDDKKKKEMIPPPPPPPKQTIPSKPREVNEKKKKKKRKKKKIIDDDEDRDILQALGLGNKDNDIGVVEDEDGEDSPDLGDEDEDEEEEEEEEEIIKTKKKEEGGRRRKKVEDRLLDIKIDDAVEEHEFDVFERTEKKKKKKKKKNSQRPPPISIPAANSLQKAKKIKKTPSSSANTERIERKRKKKRTPSSKSPKIVSFHPKKTTVSQSSTENAILNSLREDKQKKKRVSKPSRKVDPSPPKSTRSVLRGILKKAAAQPRSRPSSALPNDQKGVKFRAGPDAKSRRRRMKRGYGESFDDLDDPTTLESDMNLVLKFTKYYYESSESEVDYAGIEIGKYGCKNCRRILFYQDLYACSMCKKFGICKSCTRKLSLKTPLEYTCSDLCRLESEKSDDEKKKQAHYDQILLSYERDLERKVGNEDQKIRKENPHLRGVQNPTKKPEFKKEDLFFSSVKGMSGEEVNDPDASIHHENKQYVVSEERGCVVMLIEFMTRCYFNSRDLRDTVLIVVGKYYVGLEIVLRLFKNLGQLIIYDSGIRRNIDDGRLKVRIDNIKREDVNGSLRREIKKTNNYKNVLLFFGIEDKKENMGYIDQENVCKFLNPDKVMFRFHDNFRTMKKKTDRLKVYEGEMFSTPFQRMEGTVTHLFVKDYSGRKKMRMDIVLEEYINKLRYFHEVTRCTYFKEELKFSPSGCDGCWDCKYMVFVVENFMHKTGFKRDEGSEDFGRDRRDILDCIIRGDAGFRRR